MAMILIRTIPHKDQRYDTVGDWREVFPYSEISVSRLGNWRYEAAIAIHELVEMLGCLDKGITEEAVTDFDIAYQGDGEPGDDPAAPYHKQHEFATMIERQIIDMFGLDWDAYDAAVSAMSKQETEK